MPWKVIRVRASPMCHSQMPTQLWGVVWMAPITVARQITKFTLRDTKVVIEMDVPLHLLKTIWLCSNRCRCTGRARSCLRLIPATTTKMPKSQWPGAKVKLLTRWTQLPPNTATSQRVNKCQISKMATLMTCKSLNKRQTRRRPKRWSSSRSSWCIWCPLWCMQARVEQCSPLTTKENSLRLPKCRSWSCTQSHLQLWSCITTRQTSSLVKAWMRWQARSSVSA